ncbi:MAG: hypothetical protein M3Y27_08325, partial [Acidobacteriota bacterium]|nr:hypothetical protein [Acidobacteriota bacterium]
PYVNVPAGGTIAVSVGADRRGYDGPIKLTIADLPKGIRVEGGYIPREYVDPNNARSFNRRGVLNITADAAIGPGADLSNRQLIIWGEGKLADGSTLRRRARGPGMVIDVAGATAQGVVDRQRPITAPWLGLDLPASVSEAGAATLEVKQTAAKRLDEGMRYEFEYTWKVRTGTPPKDVNADVIGARDIRVVDMKPAGKSGTFAVTTTKATDPARYDMYVSGRVKTQDGDVLIVSRPIPFEVPEGSTK